MNFSLINLITKTATLGCYTITCMSLTQSESMILSSIWRIYRCKQLAIWNSSYEIELSISVILNIIYDQIAIKHCNFKLISQTMQTLMNGSVFFIFSCQM